MKKKRSTAYHIWLFILVVLFGLGMWLTIDGAIRYARSPHTTRNLPEIAGTAIYVPNN